MDRLRDCACSGTRDVLRPAFATHNAHSLAVILETAGDADFEMQRLHGMGEALYGGVVGPGCPVRVYAPVGSHEDLLAYLVRRLLENGANTSFVHRLVDPAVPEDAIVADPAGAPAGTGRPSRAFPARAPCIPIARIPPVSIWRIARKRRRCWPPSGRRRCLAICPDQGGRGEIRDPADRRRLIGTAADATPAEIDDALCSPVSRVARVG